MAGKARVHELAKELGKTSKEIMAKLQDLGEFVKSPSSTIEAPVVRKLRDAFPADTPGKGDAPAGVANGSTSTRQAQPGRPGGAPGRPAAVAPAPAAQAASGAPASTTSPRPATPSALSAALPTTADFPEPG